MTFLKYRRGFTLMELLVVMAIIGLLAAASLPAISSLTSSFNLTGSTSNLLGTLNYGRQQAIALNEQVEFRFYRFVSPDFSNEPPEGNFHGYQLFADAPNGGGSKPLTRVQFLPGRLIFSSDEALSALLVTGCPLEISVTNPSEKNLPFTYTAKGFHFLSNGSTDINYSENSTPNFVTLADIASLMKAGTGIPPSNYVTVVIDTISGTAKALRPGA